MKKIWIGTFENSEIKIENTWFNGERLFVNNVLQDETYGFVGTKLLGHVIDMQGNKLLIKANLGGYFYISCRLFVDDRKIELLESKS
ncbi:hypothetical protein [Daejeonella oryzae]|uniref:hypothetical protein n=1 Tax=Daejeonella oryzae TaxID=1122943 RepID=UPI00040CA94B|nr:hypothetical protein [Daejeonella oryzae]